MTELVLAAVIVLLRSSQQQTTGVSMFQTTTESNAAEPRPIEVEILADLLPKYHLQCV